MKVCVQLSGQGKAALRQDKANVQFHLEGV